MNKALIPAFFLLGSLILGISVMVPQFANAQGEQKVNDQQMQALKLFFNAQNPSTNDNKQTETSSNSQSSQVQTQQVNQQQQQQVTPSSIDQGQQSTNNNEEPTASNPQTANIQ